jgi:hypothetical protein
LGGSGFVVSPLRDTQQNRAIGPARHPPYPDDSSWTRPKYDSLPQTSPAALGSRPYRDLGDPGGVHRQHVRRNTSRWLLPLWTKLFGPVSAAQWADIHFYIRKTGHFIGYGTVSLGFLRAGRSPWSTAGLAILSTAVLATWDEWHQSFLPGRTSSPHDVLLDTCGALLAQLLPLGSDQPVAAACGGPSAGGVEKHLHPRQSGGSK